MKKALTFSLIISIFILSLSTQALANTSLSQAPEGTSVFMSALDKTSFANEMDKVYTADKKEDLILTATKEELNLKMMQVQFAQGADRTELLGELAQYGVYEFEAKTMQPMSGTSDVTINTPNIFYEAIDKTWSVTCGGTWKNKNWNENIFPGDVGGQDGFGVGYTQLSKPYNSLVVSSQAYITNQDQSRSVTTYYRSDGDGSKGFGFRLQDYIISAFSYVGYKWYGICTYNSNFGSYSGIATAYYIHTYSSAVLSSVTFGVNGKTAGISVSITNENKSFTGFSNDKRFGT